MEKAKTLCVYSPKGGIGTSSIVISLAGILSLKKKRVLLVDLDLFNGSLCLLINENITKTIYKLQDDYNNNRYKAFEDYVYSYNEYIDILSSPKDPRYGNKIDSKYVNIILDKATGLYDYIIFDTSTDLNPITLLTLDVVDNVLFVTSSDIMSLKNIRNILNIFNDLNINNYKVLLSNMFYKNVYFDLNDVKKIINNNVDYHIKNSFYIKEYNNLIFHSKIPILQKNILKRLNKEIKVFELIINDICKEGETNEKK